MIIINASAPLDIGNLFGSFPGGVAQGMIWGIMALGVYITFRMLDIADLTVDGTFTTGGAVAAMLIIGGMFCFLLSVALGNPDPHCPLTEHVSFRGFPLHP